MFADAEGEKKKTFQKREAKKIRLYVIRESEDRRCKRGQEDRKRKVAQATFVRSPKKESTPGVKKKKTVEGKTHRKCLKSVRRKGGKKTGRGGVRGGDSGQNLTRKL